MLFGDLFPDPRLASRHGLLAVGGRYHPLILLEAYSQGIFPWPSEDMPYAWFSPDPRMVLPPAEVHISRSLAKRIRQEGFRVSFDTAFEAVIEACAHAPRHDQGGTWITDELIDGFTALHHLGLAHSVEVWSGNELSGGLYGLALGTMFCGESMFHRRTDASKIAFVTLARQLEAWGFRLVDCQLHNPHLERLGAREWSRSRYLDVVERAIAEPTRRGSWTRPAEVPAIPFNPESLRRDAEAR